jgi:two-component system, NarL family, response regulator LiaR
MPNTLSFDKTKRKTLTPQERIILKLVSKGCSSQEIADRLFISVETVKKHLQHCYRKLEAKNKIEALRNAGYL